jgi:hypothetical protein
MGKHLDAIVPLFLQFLGHPNDEDLQNEQTNELRETCLQVRVQNTGVSFFRVSSAVNCIVLCLFLLLPTSLACPAAVAALRASSRACSGARAKSHPT